MRKSCMRWIVYLMVIIISISTFVFAEENMTPPLDENTPTIEPESPSPLPPAEEPQIEPQAPNEEVAPPTVPPVEEIPHQVPPIVPDVQEPVIQLENPNLEVETPNTISNSVDEEGHANLLLDSLNSQVGILKPSFKPEIKEYVIYVKDSNAYCDIQATAKNNDLSVIYHGDYYFTNKVLERHVDVIGDDGEKLRYTVKFVRIDKFDFFDDDKQILYKLGLIKNIINESKYFDIENIEYGESNISVLKAKEGKIVITSGKDYEEKESLKWMVLDNDKGKFVPISTKTKGKNTFLKINDDYGIKVVSSKNGYIVKDAKGEFTYSGWFYAIVAMIGTTLIICVVLARYIFKHRKATRHEQNRKTPYLTLESSMTEREEL